MSSRTVPPRRFEDYILTKLIDAGAGLTSVQDSQFTLVPGQVGAADRVLSSDIDIGFPFEFDGIVYKKVAIQTNGWMALQDPILALPFAFSDVLAGQDYDNHNIRSTFLTNSVLLAPWFDNFINMLSAPEQLNGGYFVSSQTRIDRVIAGLEPPPLALDPVSAGIKYFHDDRSTKGRRFIVRWASLTNIATLDDSLKKPLFYEVVLYENGTIEFRYAPNAGLRRGDYTGVDSATCGIFMPGGTDRFRDFSSGLGYQDDRRQEYIYGGYEYSSTFTDSGTTLQNDGFSAPYVHNLAPFFNWPGQQNNGCVMTFSPPLRKRKILTRKPPSGDFSQTYPLVARTGDVRRGTAFSSFDDRKSPNFTNSTDLSPAVVNYPTTLPRFFGGNGPGTLQRQDLFSGDFLVTGSVVKSAIDQFANEQPQASIDAFNESALFDQSSNALTDFFFTSGSNPNYVEAGFNQQLRSKTQIRISLPVHFDISMPGTTSSIYYYNKKTKSWNVPINSTYIIPSASSQPPTFTSGKPAGGDWGNPRTWTTGSAALVPEDARGFGPIGNIVSSGSIRLAQAGSAGATQTDFVIGKNYVSNGNPSFATAIGKSYEKSVRNNEEYRPTNDETFTLPINSPLLIEKAVFEIPLAAGAGWFNSYTQAVMAYGGSMDFGNGSIDFSGPALTVALHRHVTLTKNQVSGSSVSQRELIMTGTIIPSTDNFHSVSILQTPSLLVPAVASVVYQVKADGFLAYASPPGCVITPDASNAFSGSAIVKSEALSASGINTSYFEGLGTASSLTKAQKLARIRALITAEPKLFIGGVYGSSTKYSKYYSVSPIGRGGTGYPSGRALLGNDAVTFQGFSDQSGKSVASPFYKGASGISATNEAILTYLNTLSNFNAIAVTVTPLTCYFPSPYLVMPGDKLVLSISKMRPPCIAGNPLAGNPFPSVTSSLGSVSHDVSLISGTINVTFYGSQVKEAIEFHDTMNQSLNSNAVHELIGAEPVIDQFDVTNVRELSGSYTDRIFSGSFISSASLAKNALAQDARIVIASNFNPNPPTVTFPRRSIYISEQLYSEFQISKMSRNVFLTSATERFYDSLVPGIADFCRADGHSTALSFILSSYLGISLGGSGITFPSNKLIGFSEYSHWLRAYPFEPTYSSVVRQSSTKKLFVSIDGSGTAIPPVLRSIDDLMIFANGFLADPTGGGTAAVTDEITSTTTATGLRNNDHLKMIYGFGDCPPQTVLGTTTAQFHHAVLKWRINMDIVTPGSFYFGPEIRGWKYGIYSAIPAFTTAAFRRDHFGQFRDMLEQRPDAKFFNDQVAIKDQISVINSRQEQSVLDGPVRVRFVDSSGLPTTPEYTMSSNLSFEATSSLPYFDGVVRNREEPLSLSLTNKNIVVI